MSRKTTGAPFSLFAFQDAITSVCGVIVLVTLLLALMLTQRVVSETEVKTVAKSKVEETRAQVETLRNNLSELNAQCDASMNADELGIGLSLPEVKGQLANARARLEKAQTESEKLDAKLVELAPVEAAFAARQEKLDAMRAEIDSTLEEASETTAEEIDSQTSAVYAFNDAVREKPWFVEIDANHIIAHGSADGTNDKSFGSPFEFTKWAGTRPRGSEYFVLIVRPSGAERFDFIQYELDEENYRYGIDLIGENKPLVFLDVKAPAKKKKPDAGKEETP